MAAPPAEERKRNMPMQRAKSVKARADSGQGAPKPIEPGWRAGGTMLVAARQMELAMPVLNSTLVISRKVSATLGLAVLVAAGAFGPAAAQRVQTVPCTAENYDRCFNWCGLVKPELYDQCVQGCHRWIGQCKALARHCARTGTRDCNLAGARQPAALKPPPPAGARVPKGGGLFERPPSYGPSGPILKSPGPGTFKSPGGRLK